MKYMFLICALVLFSCSENSSPLEPKAMTKIPSKVVMDELLFKLDSIRTLNGLEEIERLPLLTSLSYKHSLYMLEMGKISHDNFEEDRLIEISKNLKVHLAYENVGFYYGTENPSTKIFNDWTEDEEIKAHLLKGWDKMGMSVVTDSLGNYYTTQIFITHP